MLNKKLKESLDLFYTREMCERLYDIYLKNWIADGYIGEKFNIFELSMIDSNTPKEWIKPHTLF